jgi:hypothetical protein
MSDPRDDLTAFERSLSGLAPSRVLDRDRLMYESGRRAGHRETRRGWRWPAVAATLAMATIGQAVALSRRPTERIVERVVTIPAAAPTPDPEPVVILTRREPSPAEHPHAFPAASSGALSARSDPATLAETEPPMLSAVYLGPLADDATRSLTPRSILGDPL